MAKYLNRDFPLLHGIDINIVRKVGTQAKHDAFSLVYDALSRHRIAGISGVTFEVFEAVLYQIIRDRRRERLAVAGK